MKQCTSQYRETKRNSHCHPKNLLSLTALVCGGMVIGVGVIALLGWIVDVSLLASIHTGYIPMAPNTAIAFVVLGIMLFVLARWPMNHISRWVAKGTAIFVLLIGLMTLIQYVTDIDLGIDQLLLTTTKTLGMIPVGFMSPITAANFFLAGFSLLLVVSPSTNGRYMKSVSSCLATIIVFIGFVVILGYLYKTPLLYGGAIVPMALTTAVAFIFLGIGLISTAGPQCWPQCLVMGPSTRALLMRAFLPITVAIVIIMGRLYTVILLHSKSNPALMSALLSILCMVIVSVIISHIAKIIGSAIDLAETRRKLAEGQLLKLSQAVEQSPSTVVITDTQGNIEYVNPKFTQLTGYTREEAVGENPRILKTEKIPSEEYRHLWNTITSGGEWRGEFHNRKKNGELYWEYASISPIRNAEGEITHFLAVKEDITERKNFETQLAYLADHDPLTNLFNRRRFHKGLDSWLAQARRYGTHGAVLFIDLDNFKYINDTLGHGEGDALLMNLSVLLRERIRETDTLARLGGDEFAIILPYVDEAGAHSFAKHLLELVENKVLTPHRQFPSITVSIGIALFPEHGIETDLLLTCADMAMYRAKEKGRNCICMYSPTQKMKIESRLDWEKRIRDALVNNRFVLHLQPILDIKQNRMIGHEALLRMVEENDKLIFPNDFLDVAECFGLIHDIDRWVVRRAIRLVSEQQFANQGLFLEINLSGRAFNDPELLPLIKEELAVTAVNPENLIFEITETAAIESIVEAQHFITTLKSLGCRFALDDFGIGFSSFSYLKQLPVDYLKIDGSFIRDLTHNLVDQHLVKAIVEVAHRLGKQTVAEFVESEKTVQLLSEYGVDYAQGYYIGLPKAVSEITDGIRIK